MLQPPPPAPFVPVLQGQAPKGMIAAEAAILTSWLQIHYRDYDSVQYNVRVGLGQDPGPQFNETVRNQQILNSKRRIDAVLGSATGMTIVEVKVRGSLWALGQLAGYRVLWIRDNPGDARPSTLMLCASIDSDTQYVYQSLGVPFEVVLTGGSPSAAPAA